MSTRSLNLSTRCRAMGVAFQVALVAICTATGARAQAPVISTRGDPSVDPDTIYRLAADSARYNDEAVVLLLDDGVVRIDETGRGTRTYRQIVHVLRQQAVAGLAERRLRYSPDHEKLVLNWVRVLRPDGTVISDGPAQQQESDVAARVSNPVYVNQKEIRLSLGGVTPGTIIDISYTVEELKPYLPGDFYTQWNVHSGSTPVRRSRFMLDAPAGVEPRITERNLNFAARVKVANGRRTRTWSTSDVPEYRPEAFSPDTNSIHMHVVVSLPLTWSRIAQWYHSLVRDRYTLGASERAKVDTVIAGAATRLDTIRAVHRWVAQDIRYVSVSLGIGGYQARPPAETIETGFGDCKDKTTLFIAALRALGINADPVLLNSVGSLVRREHPSIAQFNHLIAAVRDGSTTTFTDLTAPWTPYGELPLPEQGGFAVIVRDDGSAEEVRLPRMAPDARRIAYHIEAALGADGLLTGVLEETNSGPGFESRRTLFGAPLDSARRASLMRGLLGIIPGARGDSIHGFDGRDLYAPVRYRLFFSSGRVTAQTGGLFLFTFPFGVLPASDRIRALEAMPERRTSIVAEEVLRRPPPTMMTVDLRVTLPEGWRVRVPNDVVVRSDLGTYSTEYSQEGRVLRILRTESSAVGTYPPSRFRDVIEFFRAIGADENNRSIVIEPGGAK